MAIKLEKLFIYTPNKSRSIAKVYICHPDENKLQFFGQLFGIVELNLPEKNYFSILDEIADEIEDTYYNFNYVKQEQFAISSHFENCLKDINSKILQILVRHHMEKKVDLFNFTLGALKNNQLFLATAGNNFSLLIYKTKTGSYRVADIVGNYHEPHNKEKIDYFKIFSHFIEGEYKINDFLLFTNPNLLNHLSLDDIKEIAVHSTLENTVEEIKNRLWQASVNTTFATILVENKSDFSKNTLEKRDASQKSINRLLKTEDTTKRILSTSLFPQWSKYSKHVVLISRHIISIATWLRGYINRTTLKTSFEKLALPKHLEKFSTSLSVLNVKLMSAVKKKKPRLFFVFPSPKFTEKVMTAMRSFRQSLLKSLSKCYKYCASTLGKIPLKIKIGSGVLVLLVLILSYNLFHTNEQNESTATLERFNRLFNEINEQMSSLEATLIYNDRTKASAMVDSIQKKLNEFPQETPEQRETANTFRDQLKKHLFTLRKIIAVQLDSPLITFNQIGTQRFTRGIRFKSDFYFYNEKNEIAKYQLTSRMVNLLTRTGITTSPIRETATNEDEAYVILLHEDRSLTKLDFKTDEIRSIHIDWMSRETKSTAIQIYNDRLYNLSAADNGVFRHNNSIAGFGIGSSWITSKPMDLTNSVSLAIDGDIYILEPNGQVQKFTSGTLKKYSLEAIDPVIKTASLIKTDFASKFLYVLEPSSQRLIVFMKDSGEFLNQYYFGETSPSDFFVDEANNILYFLLDNNLYKTAFRIK